MSDNGALAVLESTEITREGVLGLPDVGMMRRRVQAMEDLIDSVFVRGRDYGPPYKGCDKDALLQPGAEKAMLAFSLSPDYKVEEEDLGGNHKRFVVSGVVRAPDGTSLGFTRAEASTHEPKWRYRNAGISCPECHRENIRRSKPRNGQTPPPEGMGWYCWEKTEGCGATFPAETPAITDQKPGKVEIGDPAEMWHTVQSMSQKRWLVAAARRTCALSGRFVDGAAHAAAAFEPTTLGPLASRLPGTKEEKAELVRRISLEEFGKYPPALTNLEGAILMDRLRAMLADAPTGLVLDLGDEPEPEAEPSKPESNGEPAPETAKLTSKEQDRAMKAFQKAGLEEAAIFDEYGLPPTWTAATLATAEGLAKGVGS